jgi:hypothetical protein
MHQGDSPHLWDRVTNAIPHCPTETEFASMIFQVTAGHEAIVVQRKPGFIARLGTVLSVVVLAGAAAARAQDLEPRARARR